MVVSTEADLDRPNIEEYLSADSIHEPLMNLQLRDLLDLCPRLSEAAGAIVDDSFTRCFKSNSPEPWNWNVYLFPLWCLGVAIRYCILFPVRVSILAIGWLIFFAAFLPVHFLLTGTNKWRHYIEYLRPGETPIEFAERVRDMISARAGLKKVPWDGYLKYYRPSPKLTERKQQIFAESVLKRLEK
ncbi:hypothetical protein HPP92_017041 [Vanilla planifolia]|uniref:Uncharacterized protein n=1 Tax=Vanilla planifolia TaxID=51239 RepID=A0A835UTY8_VANPL|nr:hypothetical protein HPP92_017041 [Vanilla planifolia]